MLFRSFLMSRKKKNYRLISSDDKIMCECQFFYGWRRLNSDEYAKPCLSKSYTSAKLIVLSRWLRKKVDPIFMKWKLELHKLENSARQMRKLYKTTRITQCRSTRQCACKHVQDNTSTIKFNNQESLSFVCLYV